MEPQTEHEIEFKNLLTEDEFNKLCRHFGMTVQKNSKPQTNHYFDTENYDLLEQIVTLRAREKKDDWELTIKSDHPEGGRLERHHRPLIIDELDLLFTQGIIPAGLVRDAVPEFTQHQVLYQGLQETDRITIVMPFGKIMLDQNRHITKTDWEIELEVAEDTDHSSGVSNFAQADKYFSLLLMKYNIKRVKPLNKTQRYFADKLGK